MSVFDDLPPMYDGDSSTLVRMTDCVPVPRAILQLKKPGLTQVYVALALLRARGVGDPSQREIARVAGLSVPTMLRWRAELIAEGLLRLRPSSYGKTEYHDLAAPNVDNDFNDMMRRMLR